MKTAFIFLVQVATAVSVFAADQAAVMQAQRPALQTIRQPRIESVGTGQFERQFFMPENLAISFSGLGAPGQVKVLLQPFQESSGNLAPQRPGTPELTGCYYAAVTPAAPAVINADGTATARFNGYWLAKSRWDVNRDGYCRFEIRIQRMQPDMSYREEARMVSDVIRIAAHQSIKVTNTAPMRAFLKPVQSPRCAADDAGGKFGIRLTAGAAAHACRTDFLDPTDTNGRRTGNPLGQGVIVSAIVWKLDGDTNRCVLCPNPLVPCRGVTPQATYAQTLGADNTMWVYAPVRIGEIGNGYRFAIFTGPPNTPANSLIRAETNHYDYDTALPDYLDRLYSTAAGTEPSYGRTVIATADSLWRSWMRPFGIGLACSAWSPPSASAATNAIGGAVGKLAQGQVPIPPPAPYLRLVLDELNVLRPAGQRLPWE